MPRRGENIYKRKDGRWEGRYRKGHIDGKIKYGYVYGRTYREVKNRMEAMAVLPPMLPQIQNIECSEEQKPKQESFGEIAGEWLSFLKPQLKESSIVRYENILKLYLLPEFGARRISGLTWNEIMEFKNRLLDSGGRKKEGLSPKTVMDILSVFKNIVAYAAQVKEYPVTDIRRITIKQMQKPMRILSCYEQKQLNSYLCNHLTLCNLGILVCLYMGLRIGEICALKWEDISFVDQYLYVHRTMQRIQRREGEKKTEILVSTPKSGCSIRRIPIPDEIFHLILEHRHSENTYFLTGKEHCYIEPRTMQNRFRMVTRACNLADANFHALRHTFATRCVELGFDIKSLSEILGHASVNITLNRYVHPSMDLKQKNMNMLSELIAVK